MHRDDASAESARDDVVKDFGSDSSSNPIRTHDRNHFRFKERPHRRRRGLLRTLSRAFVEAGGQLEVEGHVKEAGIELSRHRKSGFEKHVHHSTVLAEYVGVEGTDARAAANFSET